MTAWFLHMNRPCGVSSTRHDGSTTGFVAGSHIKRVAP
ncbi:integrase [Salmonella phage 19]|nr:integrase [Salmonella phage 19]